MKKSTVNVVAYAVENGARRVLGSFAENVSDFELNHAASECFRDCKNRGVPNAQIVVTREERWADDNGNTHGKFRLHGAKAEGSVTDLNELFKEVK